jgi:hypothetical protein
MSETVRRLVADSQPLPSCNWSRTTILFVSHEWNPTLDSAEALAGRRLVRALVEAGARVHVLAASGGENEHTAKGYEVTVVRSLPFPTNKIGRAAKMLSSTIPEGEGTWVSPAIAAGLSVLSSLPADTVVYGRAMPGTSNIVAWHLARAKGLPWLAHFSDPWPGPHVLARGMKWLAPYKAPLFRMWRQRIVRDAGALTLTSPGHTAAILGRGRDRYLSKTFIVTHLPSSPVPSRPVPGRDLFHIVHTGNFYPVAHTSASVIQGLRLFLDQTPAARGRVRLTQAGWANGDVAAWTERCQLQDVVRLAGRLTQSEVLALLRDANLLLAIDYSRPDSTAVLSKLPDYLNAGRPILAVTAPTSSLGRLFNDDAAGLTAHYDSPADVAQQIRRVFDAWQNHRLESFLPGPVAVESFTPRWVLTELSAAIVQARQHPTLASHPLPDSTVAGSVVTGPAS